MYIDIIVNVTIVKKRNDFDGPFGEAEVRVRGPYTHEIQGLDLMPAIRSAIQQAFNDCVNRTMTTKEPSK